MQNGISRNIVNLSGGKDSTALAVYLKQNPDYVAIGTNCLVIDSNGNKISVSKGTKNIENTIITNTWPER